MALRLLAQGGWGLAQASDWTKSASLGWVIWFVISLQVPFQTLFGLFFYLVFLLLLRKRLEGSVLLLRVKLSTNWLAFTQYLWFVLRFPLRWHLSNLLSHQGAQR